MRRRSGLAVLVLALAGCGSSRATSQASTSAPMLPACGPPSAATLAEGPVARVYRQGRTVYGCAARSRARYRLGSAGFCNNSDRVRPIALEGTVAAYGVQRCGVDTGTAQIVVRRLTDGRVLHTAPATSRVPGAESFQSVGSVVVKAGGAVSWIGTANSIIGHGAVTEVHRIDAGGAAELDRGAGIAAGSLRLRGSRLSWRHSRRERSAKLS